MVGRVGSSSLENIVVRGRGPAALWLEAAEGMATRDGRGRVCQCLQGEGVGVYEMKRGVRPGLARTGRLSLTACASRVTSGCSKCVV